MKGYKYAFLTLADGISSPWPIQSKIISLNSDKIVAGNGSYKVFQLYTSSCTQTNASVGMRQHYNAIIRFICAILCSAIVGWFLSKS